MSISKSININYIWNKENVDKLFEASYRYQFENSKKRYIGWLLIAIMQYGIVLALKREVFAVLLFSTIMLAYWYYGKKWIARKRANKSFEESPFKDKNIEIDINKQGFDIKYSNEKWSWEEIDEIIVLNDDIMIYKYPNFHYIPSNGFKSNKDKKFLLSLAKTNKKIR